MENKFIKSSEIVIAGKSYVYKIFLKTKNAVLILVQNKFYLCNYSYKGFVIDDVDETILENDNK